MPRSNRSAITDEDRSFVETWEHISPQQWGIVRLDARGEDRHEVIRGRREFMLTSEERLLSQDRIRDKANDPFVNGAFRPVFVPDSITIESNPNALSDDEIEKILGSSDIAWMEYLKVIDSVATVRRMMELAEDSDLTLRRFHQLEDRLKEVRGIVRIQSNDPVLKNYLNQEAAVEDGEKKPTRRVGGMSSDYRNPDQTANLP